MIDEAYASVFCQWVSPQPTRHIFSNIEADSQKHGLTSKVMTSKNRQTCYGSHMENLFTHAKLVRPLRTKFYIEGEAQLQLRRNKFRGHWLDKPIHFYRMWFLFARIVVDCERNGIKFGAKREHSVKLNKRFYKDWQMGEFVDAQFDDWFAQKIQLFGEEEVSVVEEGEKSDTHLYLKFNKNQRKEDILRQARNILNQGKYKPSAKYQIQKQYKYFYLHQQYNAFILRQNGAKNAEVREWLETNYSRYSKRISREDAALRKLYRASERVVLDVARGDF